MAKQPTIPKVPVPKQPPAGRATTPVSPKPTTRTMSPDQRAKLAQLNKRYNGDVTVKVSPKGNLQFVLPTGRVVSAGPHTTTV